MSGWFPKGQEIKKAFHPKGRKAWFSRYHPCWP